MKEKKRRGLNKKLFLVVVIITLFVGILGYNKIIDYNDSRRFAEADKKKQQVFNELVNNVGVPLKTEEKNICYNSEQGPYDNGRLWCQVASAAYFSESIEDDKIKGYFDDALTHSRLSAKTSGEAWFDGAEGLVCRLQIDTGKFATSTPYYLSDNPESKQTVVIYCIDRAKAKHYPYID